MRAAAEPTRGGRALQSKEIRRKRPKGLRGVVDMLHHEVPQIAAIYQCSGWATAALSFFDMKHSPLSI